jgi:hypothetical protein
MPVSSNRRSAEPDHSPARVRNGRRNERQGVATIWLLGSRRSSLLTTAAHLVVLCRH